MAEEAAQTIEVKPEEVAKFKEVGQVLNFLSGKSETANSAFGKMHDFAQKTGMNNVPAKVEPPATPEIPAATPAAGTEKPAGTEVITETPAAEGNEEVEIAGVGKINFGPAKTAAPTTEYKTPEDAIAALTKGFGIEAKTPTEFVEKATKAFNGHRSAAQKAAEVDAKNKDITDTLSKLPDDLREAFIVWGEGKDYRQAFVNTGINYNKPVDQQDKNALVNTFFPNKFTKEDFEEHATTPNPAIEIAVAASLDKFSTIQSSRKVAAQANIDSQISYKKDFDASVDDSVSRIADELPFFTDKSAIEGIRAKVSQLHTLRGTPLAKEFLNDNGTVRVDAAARLALMENGKQIFAAYADRMSQLAASKATEKVVAKGADAPSQDGGHNVNTGNQEQNKVVEKVQKLVNPRKSVY